MQMSRLRGWSIVAALAAGCGPQPEAEADGSASGDADTGTTAALPTTGGATVTSTGAADETTTAATSSEGSSSAGTTSDEPSTGEPATPGCGDGVAVAGEVCFVGSTLEPAQIGHDIAIADLDLDGHLDLVLGTRIPCPDVAARPLGGRAGGHGARNVAMLQVALGDGLGGFTLVPEIMPSSDVQSNAIADDFTGDGVPDLAFEVGFGVGEMAVHPGAGDGTFAAPIVTALPVELYRLVAGDVDGDGDLDLVGAGEDGMLALRGDGAGGFVAAPIVTAGPRGSSMTLFDVDGDAALDLVVGHGAFDAGGLEVLLGDGTGAWTSVDFTDRPGLKWMAVLPETAAGTAAVVVALQNESPGILGFDLAADGTLGPPQPIREDESMGGIVGQFDGGARSDLLLLNLDVHEAILGDAAWPSPPVSVTAPDPPWYTDSARGDLNEDGLDDVVIAENAYTIMLSNP